MKNQRNNLKTNIYEKVSNLNAISNIYLYFECIGTRKIKDTTNVFEKRVEKMATELSLKRFRESKIKVLLEKQSNDYNKLKVNYHPRVKISKVK